MRVSRLYKALLEAEDEPKKTGRRTVVAPLSKKAKSKAQKKKGLAYDPASPEEMSFAKMGLDPEEYKTGLRFVQQDADVSLYWRADPDTGEDFPYRPKGDAGAAQIIPKKDIDKLEKWRNLVNRLSSKKDNEIRFEDAHRIAKNSGIGRGASKSLAQRVMYMLNNMGDVVGGMPDSRETRDGTEIPAVHVLNQAFDMIRGGKDSDRWPIVAGVTWKISDPNAELTPKFKIMGGEKSKKKKKKGEKGKVGRPKFDKEIANARKEISMLLGDDENRARNLRRTKRFINTLNNEYNKGDVITIDDAMNIAKKAWGSKGGEQAWQESRRKVMKAKYVDIENIMQMSIDIAKKDDSDSKDTIIDAVSAALKAIKVSEEDITKFKEKASSGNTVATSAEMLEKKAMELVKKAKELEAKYDSQGKTKDFGRSLRPVMRNYMQFIGPAVQKDTWKLTSIPNTQDEIEQFTKRLSKEKRRPGRQRRMHGPDLPPEMQAKHKEKQKAKSRGRGRPRKHTVKQQIQKPRVGRPRAQHGPMSPEDDELLSLFKQFRDDDEE